MRLTSTCLLVSLHTVLASKNVEDIWNGSTSNKEGQPPNEKSKNPPQGSENYKKLWDGRLYDLEDDDHNYVSKGRRAFLDGESPPQWDGQPGRRGLRSTSDDISRLPTYINNQEFSGHEFPLHESDGSEYQPRQSITPRAERAAEKATHISGCYRSPILDNSQKEQRDKLITTLACKLSTCPTLQGPVNVYAFKRTLQNPDFLEHLPGFETKMDMVLMKMQDEGIGELHINLCEDITLRPSLMSALDSWLPYLEGKEDDLIKETILSLLEERSATQDVALVSMSKDKTITEGDWSIRSNLSKMAKFSTRPDSKDVERFATLCMFSANSVNFIIRIAITISNTLVEMLQSTGLLSEGAENGEEAITTALVVLAKSFLQAEEGRKCQYNDVNAVRQRLGDYIQRLKDNRRTVRSPQQPRINNYTSNLYNLVQ